MRSAVHDVFGDPAEVLHPSDQPTPEPGSGQVRIRTLLAPIHNHDLWTVRGEYGYKPSLPAIGGSEAVGIVDALGEGVDAALLGQRVTASGHGTWAEFFLANAQGLVSVPDAIPDEAAAQLVFMPFSAIALLDFLSVSKGDWIVQNSANGAVGKSLAMLARARGVHTVNLVRRDAGVGELAAFGIDNVVSTAGPDWKAQVRAITGDAAIRGAVDSIGGAASADLAELLGEGGLLVCFGTGTGEAMQIPSAAMIFKQLTLKGFWVNMVSAAISAERKAALIGELVTLAADGRLALPVEAIFGLDNVSDAVQAARTPGRRGKVLVRP